MDKKVVQSEMSAVVPVAIVGAGPYGLSLAAHLHKCRVGFRIFGIPMEVWRTKMPNGMRLKSEGFASDIYDPDRTFTLQQYCRENGIAYSDYRIPVDLNTFVSYALDFQKRCVPMLEPVNVHQVSKVPSGFRLHLEDGRTLLARAVVMATGISFFRSMPETLASLPSERCTHSSAHSDLSTFRDLRVAVVGGGSSAADLAALLHRAGASVDLISRRPLKFHLPPGDKPRPLLKRMRRPNLGLGPGLRSSLYTVAPGWFHCLPRDLRKWVVRRHLGPSGGWFIKDEVYKHTQMHPGSMVNAASLKGRKILLQLIDQSGSTKELEVDHVIAATGYRVSVPEIAILEKDLRSELKLEGQSPVLSRNFESSVRGLYFIGLASANSFGPLMRFALGANYTARRLSTRLQGICSESVAAGTARAASS
jgi:cation diffusion facilitator CzcD-associated flavoprotein CzcO